jgi:hypothetical protein
MVDARNFDLEDIRVTLTNAVTMRIFEAVRTNLTRA